MSILCSICQENLTARPESLAIGQEDLGSIALQCGHMFHDSCVRQWFTGSTMRNTLTESRVKDCPCCKKSASLRNAIKIYPTCDEEEELNLSARFREAMSQVEQLTRNLLDFQKKLADKQAQLDREMEAHDDLKMKYAESLSKADQLSSQLDEVVEKQRLDQAVENSIKTAMKDMEKRTDGQVRELLRRIKELEEELEKKNNEGNDVTIVQGTEHESIALSPIKSLEHKARRLHITTMGESDDDDEDTVPVFSSTRVFAM